VTLATALALPMTSAASVCALKRSVSVAESTCSKTLMTGEPPMSVTAERSRTREWSSFVPAPRLAGHWGRARPYRERAPKRDRSSPPGAMRSASGEGL
jgi:hypothetical protein